MRIMRAVVGLHILILRVTLLLQLIACTCHSSVLVISLCYVSVQILQKSRHFCSLPDPKGQRIVVVIVYIMMTLFSSVIR